MNVAPYRKAIVAAVGVVALIGKAAADGTIDATEVGEIVTGILLAFGVWGVRNEDEKNPWDGPLTS